MFVQQRVYTHDTLNISEQDEPPSKWIWNMISPSMAYTLRTIYDDILYRNSWAIIPSYFLSTACRYLCTVSEDGVMCIQCKGEIIGRLLQLRDRWSVQQF